MEFYEGAFDASNPRKGGVFNAVPATHDVTDELAAYKLAERTVPWQLRYRFYKSDSRDQKRVNEQKIIAAAR